MPYEIGVATPRITVGLFWLATILVLVWLHRAVKSVVEARRRDFAWTPAQAIMWWFVPIASFVQVPRIVSATWRARRPDGAATPLVAIWWSTYLASALVTTLSRTAGSDATWPVSLLLSSVSGVCLASIIAGIDANQRRMV